MTIILYKLKNHFSEIKGDVGMSPHEKRRETRGCLHQNRNSFITPSLHLCLVFVCVNILLVIRRYQLCQQYLHLKSDKERNKKKQR